MKNNNFLKSFLSEVFPWKIIPTLFQFLFRGKHFIKDIKNDNWDGKSRPATYFIGTWVISSLLLPFTGSFSGKANNWAEVLFLGNMRDELIKRFFLRFSFEEKLCYNLSQNDCEKLLEEEFFREAIRHSSSKMSNIIEQAVGSLDINSIAAYLDGRDLQEAFLNSAKYLEKYNSHVFTILFWLIPLYLFSSTAIIHLILRNRKNKYKYLLNTFIYYYGLWSIIGLAIVSYGENFVPRNFELTHIIFILANLTIVIFQVVHIYWILGLIYRRRSIIRRTVALLAVILTIFPIMFIILDKLIDPLIRHLMFKFPILFLTSLF